MVSSAQVVFAGCEPNCTFDAGAVRLVNNTPIGVDGAGTNCTPDGVVPEVDVSVDGVASAFPDTAQVLNTGGVDRAVCAGGPNESERWALVGTQSCPGSVLSLAPSTQSRTVGSPANVTVHLANSCGTGLQGANIDFKVQSGPDSGTTGSVSSDTNGDAVFSYTGSATGTDTLAASATNPAGTITSTTVDVVWQQRQSKLSITGGASSGDYNDPATVGAVLTDNLGPVSGQNVAFALNGAETCSAVTNASGGGSCTLTPHEAAGSYPLTATLPGTPPISGRRPRSGSCSRPRTATAPPPPATSPSPRSASAACR